MIYDPALMLSVRHAGRTLRRNPRLTIPVVVLLAIAVGATGAAFSLVHAILLRPLPFPQPQRLVMVWSSAPDQAGPDTVAWPDFLDWRRQSTRLAGLAAFNVDDRAVSGGAAPERLPGAAVSPGFFTVLGVKPWVGRFFGQDASARSESGVVVLSYGLWQRRFAGRADALGQTLQLSGELFQVVGVAPPDMRQPEPFVARAPQYWVPLGMQPWMADRRAHALRVVGRLRPDVTPEAARVELDAIARRIHREHPDADPGVRVVPLHRQLVGDVRPGVLMLMAAMAALWLVACANAGNHLLTFRLHRQRDLEVRTALGASRWLLIRQAAWEGLLLGFAAGLPGLLLGAAAGRLLADRFPVPLPALAPLHFGAAAATATLALAVASGLAASLPVVFQLAGQERRRLLGLRGGSSGRGAAWARGALLMTEVAFALPLVVGAGVLAQSLAHLLHVDPGFRAPHVLSFSVELPASRYPGRPQQTAFYNALVDALGQAPGVAAAGVMASLPLSGLNDREQGVLAEGAGANRDLSAHYQVVTAGTFAALGMPLLAGRGFAPGEGSSAVRVAIVSRSLARVLWPGADPLGRRVSFDYGVGAAPRWMTVVGVAGDLHQQGLASPPSLSLYRPLGQDAMETMAVVVRSRTGETVSPSLVQAAVHRLDPDLTLADVQPLGRLLAAESARPRFLSILVETVALLTLAIAVIGIASLMGYLNRLRRRELAVRLALGAQRSDLERSLVAPAVRWLALGALLGLAAALISRSLLAQVVFGITPTDPSTLAAACLLILVLGLVAAYLPARSAARTDVREALQHDA